MRRLTYLMLALLLFGVLAMSPGAFAADRASVHALLISASKGKGGSDPRLASYEATLKRTLPFDTFKLVSEGSASVSGSGKSALSLSGGHRLELSGGERAGGGIKVRVEWTQGGRTLMNTEFTLKAGVPVVMGRGGEGEVPVVLLIAK